jgi:hypothetical protein
VICTKCNNISNQYENMMDLTVEIHGDAASLEECLDQFTVKECLQGENMYKCDGYDFFSFLIRFNERMKKISNSAYCVVGSCGMHVFYSFLFCDHCFGRPFFYKQSQIQGRPNQGVSLVLVVLLKK